MADLFDLASRLTSGCSISGFEHGQLDALEYIRDKYFDEMRREPAGSYVFIRRAKKPGYPRIMFDAHMDEVGMVVTEILEDGFLHVTNVGGLDTRILQAAARKRFTALSSPRRRIYRRGTDRSFLP